MSNILTQKEIDELLLKLTGGPQGTAAVDDSPPPAYKPYDFRTANKFTKEQIRTLSNIFEQFAFLLSTHLRAEMHTPCEINLISIEEQRFGEFNNSIPTPIILAVVDAKPFRAPILIEMAPPIVYGIVSRLFGGEADYEMTTKNFTEIELSAIQKLITEMLPKYEEAWEKVVEIDAKLSKIETNPQFTQIVANNEPTAIITFDVKIDVVQDIMAICIPHFVIQPIEKKLSIKAWAAQPTNMALPGQDIVISRQLSNTPLTLTASFDEMDIPFCDLLTLRVGDVICLNHSIDQFITMKVEHIPKFKGILGVSDQKQVIQIAEIIKESQDSEQ